MEDTLIQNQGFYHLEIKGSRAFDQLDSSFLNNISIGNAVPMSKEYSDETSNALAFLFSISFTERNIGWITLFESWPLLWLNC